MNKQFIIMIAMDVVLLFLLAVIFLNNNENFHAKHKKLLRILAIIGLILLISLWIGVFFIGIKGD